jgi:hypothetical protein
MSVYVSKTVNEDTVAGMTRAYNFLVPEAKALGISGVKIHTSLFGTRAGGLAVLTKLQAAIAARRAAIAAAPPGTYQTEEARGPESGPDDLRLGSPGVGIMTRTAKQNRSQWASTYAAAAELSRRGYLVTLTIGNAPAADLLAMAPSGEAFAVEVKGLSSANAWWVKVPPARSDLYYVFVLVAEERAGDRFFIVPAVEVAGLLTAYRTRFPNDTKFSGLRFPDVFLHEGRWDLLPR